MSGAVRRKNTEKNIISVIDEFEYSTQNESYSNEFKKWRKKKNNPYSFNFSVNKKESIFVDGKGFIESSSFVSERSAINKIFFIIGVAMLFWIVIERIVSKIAVFAFDRLGFDIHTTMLSSAVYGSGRAIVTVIIFTSVLKYTIPALYFYKKLKMPSEIAFMKTMNSPIEIIESFGTACIISSVFSVPSAYSSTAKEIYTFFSAVDTDVSVWGQADYVVYVVYDIIVLSVLSEFLFRGAVFTALRQFGDIFAIVVTSLVSALLVQDVREMPRVFIISVVASVAMLRSGSIMTAIFVNVFCKMYGFAIAIIQFSTWDYMFMVRNFTIMGTFCLGIGIVSAIEFKKAEIPKNYFAKYNGEADLRQRIDYIMHSFPFPIVSAVCIISSLMKTIF